MTDTETDKLVDEKKDDKKNIEPPEDMTNPPDKWDETDEEGYESFPASDPPANY